MSVVTVSSKYQIVIPKEIRAQLNIQPGSKLDFKIQPSHVEVTRVPTMEEACGLLQGMEWKSEELREKSDRTL